MKSTKNTAHFAIKLIFNLTIISAVMAASCSMFGGFTRGTAAKAIQNDKRYPYPSTMTIDIRGRIANARAFAWQISEEDTAEAAMVRAKEDFATRQPQIIVAEQLGYINLYFENPELGGKEMGMPIELSMKKMGVWEFKARAEITEKGKQLWKDLNLEANNEFLPLAVREEPNITGISDDNATMKKVDFTYRWKPTPLGEAFDSKNSAFASLPKELQENLQKNQNNMFGGGSNNIADFSTVRKGTAHFQKFDDGWRISNLAL